MKPSSKLVLYLLLGSVWNQEWRKVANYNFLNVNFPSLIFGDSIYFYSSNEIIIKNQSTFFPTDIIRCFDVMKILVSSCLSRNSSEKGTDFYFVTPVLALKYGGKSASSGNEVAEAGERAWPYCHVS